MAGADQRYLQANEKTTPWLEKKRQELGRADVVWRARSRRTDNDADEGVVAKVLVAEELLVRALVVDVDERRVGLEVRVRVVPAHDLQVRVVDLVAHLHLRARIHLHIVHARHQALAREDAGHRDRCGWETSETL